MKGISAVSSVRKIKAAGSLGPDFCEKRSIFFVFEDSFERFLSRLETKKWHPQPSVDMEIKKRDKTTFIWNSFAWEEMSFWIPAEFLIVAFPKYWEKI